MQIDELADFIKYENRRLNSKFKFKSKKEELLAKTVKLFEEIGELASEILGRNKYVRKEKISNYSNETLSDEIADSLITLLLLADTLKVDVGKSLQEKIKKINKRHKQEGD